MPPQTKPGTRRLSEVARHVVVPDGIVTTGYPAVEAKCRDFGITHDDWQQGLGRLILGKRADGKYAATVGGVVLSIPRQVGKTFTIGSIVVALCLLFPRMTVLWTAHRTRTSNETFAAMKAMTGRRKIKPHMLQPRSVNGEQEVRFRNGSRILFGARETGFGRGFAEVDVEVFDEAQILTERALEDMVAATNQAKHPAGALLFYMGTPPRPIDPGESFRNKRTKALDGKSKDTVYVELSADSDADPDDREQWAKGNPSYPMRTPVESMMRLRENVGSDESFLREGLGIWDDLTGANSFGAGKWEACASENRPKGLKPGSLAVAASFELTHAAIGAASLDDDGVMYLKSLRHGPRLDWLVPAAKELQDELGVDVVIDGKGPAAALIPAFEAASVRLRVAQTSEVLDACADLFQRVREKRARHGSYPELDEAVRVAVKRNVGDRWAWGRRQSGDDISPLEGVTLAAWGAANPADNYSTGWVMSL